MNITLPLHAKLTPNNIGVNLTIAQKDLSTLCKTLKKINSNAHPDDLGAYFLQNLQSNLEGIEPLKSSPVFSVDISKGRKLARQMHQNLDMILPLFLIQLKMLHQASKNIQLEDDSKLLIEQLTQDLLRNIAQKSTATEKLVKTWLSNTLTFDKDYNYNLAMTMIGSTYIAAPSKSRLKVLGQVLSDLSSNSAEYKKLLSLARKKSKELNCLPCEVQFPFSEIYYKKLFSREIPW